jgi:hypothetical protein
MQHQDLRRAVWRKSSYSGNATANCVSVAHTDQVTGVRDSKNPAIGPLVVAHLRWTTFLTAVKAGAFDR